MKHIDVSRVKANLQIRLFRSVFFVVLSTKDMLQMHSVELATVVRRMKKKEQVLNAADVRIHVA